MPEESHNIDEENGTRDASSKCWKLRGVQWRVKLGVLPSSPAPVDELRRAAADGRRRYAELRRHLLVDPHLMEEGQRPTHLIDNPLSLDPESIWGRFFRNAELERTIDKDLSRLYPEHGSFFQSPACQAMLRRILLVWSLIHPHASYRQGMHELLAPLVYVLHVDVNHLEQVKHRHEDLFHDRFDSLASWNGGTEKAAHVVVSGSEETLFSDSDEAWAGRDGTFSDPFGADADSRVIVLGSDTYGAEGELGALLSSRFVEHDSYCMFDALLSGQNGAVAMADYFLTSTGSNSPVGVPPVLEASAALYRALAAIDIPLYSHLVEVGVEPQFFALRWLRLLFGREFVLDDLLLVWDAIFSASNTPIPPGEGDDYSSSVEYSARSALISALAVSMLLYVRPALLAAPDATGCLQRLLNFPQIPDVRNLIETAQLLQPMAQAAARTPPPPVAKRARSYDNKRIMKHTRSGSISPPTCQGHVGLRNQLSTPCSPELLRMSIPESYWEEKWTHSILQRVASGVDPRGMDPSGKLSSGQTSEVSEVSDKSDRQQEAASVLAELARNDTSLKQGSGEACGPSRGTIEAAQKAICLNGGAQIRNRAIISNETDTAQNGESRTVSSDDDGENLQWLYSVNSSSNETKEVSPANANPYQKWCSSERPACANKVETIIPSQRSRIGELQKQPVEALSPPGPVGSRVLGLTESRMCDNATNSSIPKQRVKMLAAKSSAKHKGGGNANGDSSGHIVQAAGNIKYPHSTITGSYSGSTGNKWKEHVATEEQRNLLHESSPGAQGLHLAEFGDEQQALSEYTAIGESNKSSILPPHSEFSLRVSLSDSDGGYSSLEDPPSHLQLEKGSLGDDMSQGRSLTSSPSRGSDASKDNMEDSSQITKDPSLLDKLNSTPPTLVHTSKPNWVWTLGKSTDKTGSTVSTGSIASVRDSDITSTHSAPNVPLRRPKRWWRSSADVLTVSATTRDLSPGGNNLATGCTQESPARTIQECFKESVGSEVSMPTNDADLQREAIIKEVLVEPLDSNPPELVKKTKEKGSSAVLQAFGQSMLEHIQVLESALTQRAPVLRREQPSKTVLGGKGHVAALVALAELRKISSALQQM